MSTVDWLLVLAWALLNIGGAAYYVGKSNGSREARKP
jgi:hypothetical protein